MRSGHREPNDHLVWGLEDVFGRYPSVRKGCPERMVVAYDAVEARIDAVISVEHDARRVEVEVAFALGRDGEGGEGLAGIARSVKRYEPCDDGNCWQE